MDKVTLGVIIGNRGFFSSKLCENGREELMAVLEKTGVNPVVLPASEGVAGSVETPEDARKCAELFKKHREAIQGVLVSLPNFGDEKGVVETLRRSGLNVPVLVHAFADELDKLDYENRRDSFCGKISVCNNLRQYGIKFSLTSQHTAAPDSDEFKADLEKFLGICRVIDKLRGARIGEIGPRPADFNTVRYSEKLLENYSITVEPIGLIDLIGLTEEMDDGAASNALEEIQSYIDTTGVPEKALQNMARFLKVVRGWVDELELDTVAFQCWDSIQQHLGINVCTLMSMLSSAGIPSSCEVDVMGALSMLALQEAAQAPSALVDWNNNYADDPDKAVIFHCGNYAIDLYSQCCMKYAEILASSLGEENTYGSIEGNLIPGPITFARISTDDSEGRIRAYLAEGEVTDDRLDTMGSWGVVEVDDLQDLLQYICRNGFEHHVAINLSSVSDILYEAFTTYMGWEVYEH